MEMESKTKKKLSENILEKFSMDFLRNQVLKNAYGNDDTVIAKLDPRILIVWYLFFGLAPWFVNDLWFLMACFLLVVVTTKLARVAGLVLLVFAVGVFSQTGYLLLVSLLFGGNASTIAPLLVLWMGYDMAPKIALVVIVCFFPMAVGLLDGFRSADQDTVNLLRSMGASKGQIFRMVKLPSSLGRFFSSLRVSVSYSIVGAVIAEWLGGNSGLGVYMTRVRKSYAFDKMFAVIVLISLISLLLMWLVSMIQRLCMPYEKYGGNQS